MLGHFTWLITKAGGDIREGVIELNPGFYQWPIKFKGKLIDIRFNTKVVRKS